MYTKVVCAISLFLASQAAFGMGHKRMNVTEIKGVTESQLSKSEDSKSLSVMVRGKAAELLYRTLDEKKVQQTGTPALVLLKNKNTTHWTVKGKQVSCSRIQKKNAKFDDYACAFELDRKGEVAGKVEPFTPTLFNLVKTKTQAKLFPQGKPAGRGLASAGQPMPYQAAAYVMFDKGEKAKREYEDTLIVFKGAAAAQIMGFLTEAKGYREFVLAGAKGVKGKEISCLSAKGAEPERCAIVLSLASGSVSTLKNPLFR
jgi:hypothetical protein